MTKTGRREGRNSWFPGWRALVQRTKRGSTERNKSIATGHGQTVFPPFAQACPRPVTPWHGMACRGKWWSRIKEAHVV